jgi:hypothetical protein
MLTALLVAITNAVQVVNLPTPANYDLAFFQAYFDTRDAARRYGIKIEALSSDGRVLANSVADDIFVPPCWERTPLVLPPATVSVRCSIIAPQTKPRVIPGFWSQASFSLCTPELHIRRDGSDVVVTWFDPGCTWRLERKTASGWKPSLSRVLAEGCGIFRLSR